MAELKPALSPLHKLFPLFFILTHFIVETTKLRSSPLPYREHIKATIRLSGPVIIGQLGHVMMGVIDNMMIGDLGYEYLSAASLANGMFFIITVIGLGVSMIISPLVAEADSSGDARQAGLFLQQGLVVAVLLAVIMTLLNHFSIFLFPYMDQPSRDVELASSYQDILGLGILPFLVFFVGKNFVDGLSLTRPAMYVTLLGLAFNVFANWLLIYGHWGLPRLELDGAGYGTLGARTFMALLMLAYIYKGTRFQTYRPAWSGLKPEIIKKILKLGIPSGFQWFFEVGAFVGAAFMVGWIGSAERAAHQIVLSLASISFMFVTGISAGATIRVGNALGKKDREGVRRAGLAGLFLATAFMSLSAFVFVVGRNGLPALFLDLEAVVKPGMAPQPDTIFVLGLASQLMWIAALFQVFDGIQAVGAGILRGIQDVKIPTWITFIAYWVIALPLGYLLAFPLGLGLNGIWYSLVISLMASAAMLSWRFLHMSRQVTPPPVATPRQAG